MREQNFGSGVLAGFQGVAQLGQQRAANQLSRDKLGLQERQLDMQESQFDLSYDQAQAQLKISDQTNNRQQRAADQLFGEGDRKRIKEENGSFIGNLMSQGYVDESDPTKWNYEKTAQLVEQGGQNVDANILNFAKRDTDLPEGYTPDRVERTAAGIIISGSYEDGSRGVLTEDGKISNDSKVGLLSPEILSGLMRDEYTGNIVGNSDLGRSSELAQFLAMRGVSQQDAIVQAQRFKEQATLQTNITAKIADASMQLEEAERVGMKRAFKAALASAKTPADKLQILTEQAELLGVDVPSILTDAPAIVEKGSVQERLAEAGITPESWAKMSEDERQSALDTVEASANKKLQPNLPHESGVLGISTPRKKLDDISMAQADDSFTAIADQSAETAVLAQELQEGMFAQIDGMTPEQVIEYIDGGGFKSSGEDEAKLAKVLQAAQVETLEDIERLPTKAQLSTRAWLYAISPDSMKTQIAKEITNLGTGGTAASSARELQNSATQQMVAVTGAQNARTGAVNAITSAGTLDLNVRERGDALRKHDWDVGQVMGAEIVTAFQGLDKTIYELNDDGEPTSDMKYNARNFAKGMSGADGALTKIARLRNGAEPDSPEEAQLRSATNSLYSVGIQVMAASEEYGSFGEVWPDGEINFVDGNDRFLARVFVAKSDKYGPTRFGIRSLGTNTQLDETIPAGKVKSLFGNEGFKDFVEQLSARKGQ